MATAASLINKVNCGSSEILGTGNDGCLPFFQDTVSIWVLPKGYEIPKSTELNSAFIESLKVQQKLIVLDNVIDFTPNTEQDQIETFGNGIKRVIREGLYEYTAQFSNGLYFNKALQSLKSFRAFSIMLVDSEGTIFGSETSTGITGFSVGMLQPQPITLGTTTTVQREGINFQFTNRRELDSNYFIIKADNLDFDPSTEKGVNQALLSFETLPAAGDTITVSAVLDGRGNPITGLQQTNFAVTKNGTSLTLSGLTETNGVYVLDGGVGAFVANDALTVALKSSTGTDAVAKVGSVLYKSNVLQGVVS